MKLIDFFLIKLLLGPKAKSIEKELEISKDDCDTITLEDNNGSKEHEN